MTLKDVNRKQNERYVILSDMTILSQLEKDSEFLRDCNIMDYSLLLGIYECNEYRSDNEEEQKYDNLSNGTSILFI